MSLFESQINLNETFQTYRKNYSLVTIKERFFLVTVTI